jgi:hypothetical protein
MTTRGMKHSSSGGEVKSVARPDHPRSADQIKGAVRAVPDTGEGEVHQPPIGHAEVKTDSALPQCPQKNLSFANLQELGGTEGEVGTEALPLVADVLSGSRVQFPVIAWSRGRLSHRQHIRHLRESGTHARREVSRDRSTGGHLTSSFVSREPTCWLELHWRLTGRKLALPKSVPSGTTIPACVGGTGGTVWAATMRLDAWRPRR